MDDNDDNDVDSNESSSSSSRNGDDRTNNVNVGHGQNQLTLRSFVIEIARNLHCSRHRASSERSDPHTWSKMPPMDAQARMHEIMVSITGTVFMYLCVVQQRFCWRERKRPLSSQQSVRRLSDGTSKFRLRSTVLKSTHWQCPLYAM